VLHQADPCIHPNQMFPCLTNFDKQWEMMGMMIHCNNPLTIS
jgi:hypothetical protein